MGLLDDAVASTTKKLTDAGLTVLNSRSIAYGVQLTVGDEQESITVNVYSGKKGISHTLGGSAASRLRQQVEPLVAIPCREPAKMPTATNQKLGFEDVAGFDGRWIGTDESGKGDFFGPLVICAVLVDRETEVQLVDRGVKDCKTLSDARVRALAVTIREICSGCYVELELTPARYNALYQQLSAEGKNLNQLLAWAHARVIEDMLEKVPCRFAIADQFADERLILSRLMEKGKKLTLLQSHKAERNLAVAAASVLARDRFLSRLDSFQTQYGLTFPKGASSAVIHVAKQFASTYGRAALVDVAKVHFKTTEQI